MKQTNCKVSMIIVTYNSKQYIKVCIESIIRQNYSTEIIVIDNCSRDGTVEFVIQNYPFVKIIKNEKNFGYGTGNNLGVKYAKTENIIILNPDTIMEDKCIEELIKPLEKERGLITTPKISIYDGSMINSCGHINHFTGMGFARGLGAKPDDFHDCEYVGGAVGTCFAIKKRDFVELGGFDENFFMYREDGDFAWRAHLKDLKILFVPTSVIRHDYILKVPPEKIYHLEKGRYMILRKYLSRRDFLLLSPSLLVAEFLTLGYATKHGLKGLKYKLKAMKDGLRVKVGKVSGDKENLFKSLSATIPTDQLTFNKFEKILKILANKIFEWNFKVVR